MKSRIAAGWLVLIDLVLIAAGVGVFYLFLGVLPATYAVVAAPARPPHPTGAAPAVAATRGTSTRTVLHTPTPAPSRVRARAATADGVAIGTLSPTAPGRARPSSTATPGRSAVPTLTPIPPSPGAAPPAEPAQAPGQSAELGGGKFDGMFTSGEIVQTATGYRSADIDVTLSKVQRGDVTYYVQDIYVRYIDNLRTAFARNTFGRHIAGWTPDIANENAAIGAINGDYYGTGKMGAVIRNGVLYNAAADGEVAVLFRDGTLKVYAPNDFDAEQAMAAGAYQAWDFGPGLMTPEGKAIGVFDSGIAGRNPRTALGYFEPGHYAFVVVDGRQPGYSNGMTLAKLAALFEELGCKAAYNLDGGQTSAMTFGGQVVNRPYKGGRQTSDIVFVGE